MSRSIWRKPEHAKAFVEDARRRGLVAEEPRYAAPQDRHPPYGPGTAPAEPKTVARRAKEPNQTEREYEAMLRREFPGCEIRWEALTLRMASLLTYTPDYIVFFPSGAIECHEVKGGFIFPKALVKPRMAAEVFPWRFVLAQKRKGEWEISTLNGIWTRQNPSVQVK